MRGELSSKSRSRYDNDTGGATGGMRAVDYEMLSDLNRQHGEDWMAKSAERLGFTVGDFERRALEAMEKVKRDFQPRDRAACGHIIGKTESLGFEIQGDVMKGALDKIIDKTASLIDELADGKKFGAIVVSGGGSRNCYIFDELKERYEPGSTTVVRASKRGALSDEQPVAMGCLCRHDDITLQRLPQKFGYAILQREELYEHHPNHQDCFITEEHHTQKQKKKRKKKPWTMRKPKQASERKTQKWVKESPYEKKVKVVPD